MIKVKDIMTQDVITTSPKSSIIEAAKLIVGKSVSGLVVVQKDQPIAVIGESDIVRGIISGKSKVRDIMSSDFMSISPITKFSALCNSLRKSKVKKFPVVDDGKLIGLVTETDIVEATRDFTRFHQIMQEVILSIFGLATAFFLFYFSPLGRYFLG